MRKPLAVGAALVTAIALSVTALSPTARAQQDALVYVALGDSYTSGPLVLPHDQRWVPQDCGQSFRNYPHLAAIELGLDAFKDVSCGSAKIDHFTEPQDAAVNGVAKPQFDALSPAVDVVTVGIGGNDIGFTGFALDCIRPQPPPLGDPPCTPEYKHDGIDEISQKIAATAVELSAALDELRRRAPNALVLIVNYPTALPDDGVACYPYLPILPEDMPYLVEKYKEMNAMLQTVAAAKGASYVDIYTPSIGHDACKPPGLAWVNGAVLVPPSYPAHPNDLSYLSSGPIVAQAIRAAVAERTAQTGTDSTTTTTAPPSDAARDVLPRTGTGGGVGLLAAGAVTALFGLRRFTSRVVAGRRP